MGRLRASPQSTARGRRSGEEDPPLEGALGPQSGLCEPPASFTPAAYLPTGQEEEEGGVTDVTGARQRGRRPAKRGGISHLFFQIKTARDNIV